MKSESTVTIQDVFNKFYLEYEKHHKLSAVQRKAAYHIRKCKTGAFGVNISVCEDCGCISVHYNSCRDRCCPMCQEFPKEKWVDARREDVLEAPYFHVVFTVPSTAIRSFCMMLCITHLPIHCGNWLPTANISVQTSDISAFSIPGGVK